MFLKIGSSGLISGLGSRKWIFCENGFLNISTSRLSSALFTRQEDNLEVEMLRKPFSQKIHFLEPRPEINPDDPIFKNIERASKPGKKTKWSVDHDKALYRKP